MKNVLLLPITRTVFVIVALGACSNLQRYDTGSRIADAVTRLDSQAQLQETAKARMQRLETDVQTLEAEYLRQVGLAEVAESYPLLNPEPPKRRLLINQVAYPPSNQSSVSIELPRADRHGQCFTRVPVPPRNVGVDLAPGYPLVTNSQKVGGGHLRWHRVLCDRDKTPEMVSRIQRALKDDGFDPGAVDGLVGRRTLKAVNAFQREHGLPVDQYLNVATIKALGIDLPWSTAVEQSAKR